MSKKKRRRGAHTPLTCPDCAAEGAEVMICPMCLTGYVRIFNKKDPGAVLVEHNEPPCQAFMAAGSSLAFMFQMGQRAAELMKLHPVKGRPLPS